MTDTRDPRGIALLFVRYLVLHVIFLVGLLLSHAMTWHSSTWLPWASSPSSRC